LCAPLPRQLLRALPSARRKQLPPKKTDTVSRTSERENGVAFSVPEKLLAPCTPALAAGQGFRRALRFARTLEERN